jgi:20S proteasome subunit beta 4
VYFTRPCQCSPQLTHVHTYPIFSCQTVILAADQSNARSIITYQNNLDKIKELTSHSAMGVAGPNCDFVNFTEFIAKSVAFHEFMHDGLKLSTKAQANYCRSELALALRKGPYQVNILLAGYDEKDGTASLYFLDYMASLQKVQFGAHGYASSFCLSIMDRETKPGMTEADAMQVIDHCIHEIHTRFLISQPNFMIKIVDKDGVRVAKFGGDPADS